MIIPTGRKSRPRSLTAATFLLGTVLLSCSGRAPRPPGSAVLLLESAPESLDPRFTLSVNAQRISSLIFPGLIRIDDNGQAVADLAASFTRTTPLNWRFVLRSGLTFHDGAPLTADDIVFTFTSIKDPAVGSALSGKYDRLARVIAVDPLTVDIELTEPFAPALLDLTMGIVPAHLAGLAQSDVFTANPIGAGPFRFVEQRDEEHLTLASNPGYYGGEPAIKRLEVVVVRDETTRVLSLLHGDADLLINAVSPVLLPRLARAPHLTIQAKAGAGYSYLGFNLRHPILKDIRVRQAFALAIDRQAIANFKFHGAAHSATGMLPEEHWAWAPAAAWNPDRDRAKQLLDEAGYPDPDGDGPLTRFSITYKTSTDRFRKAIALVIASELREVGIGVDVRGYEWGTFFGDVKRGRFDIITLKWTPVIEPHLMHWVFHSSSIPSAENSYVGGNRGAYSNPRVDQLLEHAASAEDDHTRRDDYREIQEILGDQLPYVPLWHEDTIAIVSQRLDGFQVSPFGFLYPLARARAN